MDNKSSNSFQANSLARIDGHFEVHYSTVSRAVRKHEKSVR